MTPDPFGFRLDLLVPLLAGHAIGDFLLQSDRMVRAKRDPLVVLLHASLVAAASWLLAGHFASWWWLLPTMIVPHFLIDLAKAFGDWRLTERIEVPPTRPAGNGRIVLFTLDQAAHLLVLAGVVWAAASFAGLRPTVAGAGVWIDLFGNGYLRTLVLLTGWIVAAPATGYFLGLLLSRFEVELTPRQKEGLTGGGHWIGLTERSLIYLFILVGEPAGIGFLAAAKSVFRIGELKEAEDRRLAEYILIGTLLSFAIAMATGLLVIRLAALPAFH